MLTTWVLLSLISTAPIEFNIQGNDISKKYEELEKQLSEQDVSWTEFQNYKILFIRGFLSDGDVYMETWPAIEKIPHGFSFVDQTNWLENEGIEFSVLTTHSEQVPKNNFKIIQRAVRDSAKPVIFISHSRGGLDVLEFLLHAEENLRSKVRGWVSLQAPFQGTPFADEVLKRPMVRKMAAGVLSKIDGDLDCVAFLSVQSRMDFMAKNLDKVKEVLQGIPMVAFSSWRPREENKVNTNYELLRDFLDYLGYQTDGIIPWQSAILPGFDYVFQKGIDHRATVHDTRFISFDRVLMTKALFALLKEKF